MTRKKYTPLQLREIFHLEFLRWPSRHVDPALYALKAVCSQIQPDERKEMCIDVETVQKARERIFEIGYEQFRDHVVSYLAEEDQKMYGNPAAWGDIQQKALTCISAL